MIQLIFKAFFSDFKNVCDVSHTEEVFHIMESIRLGISISKFCINLWLPQSFASHLQESNKIVMFASMVGNFDNFRIVGRVVCLDIRVLRLKSDTILKDGLRLTDRVFDAQAVELGFSKTTPNFGFVNFVSIIQTAVDGNDVFDEDINSHSMLVVLLVNRQGFLIQAMFGCDLGDITGIVVLQLVDVTDDLPFVCPDGRQQQEILKVLVVTEGRRLDDYLLEQFDELQGEVGFDEGMDGNRDVVRVSALW